MIEITCDGCDSSPELDTVENTEEQVSLAFSCPNCQSEGKVHFEQGGNQLRLDTDLRITHSLIGQIEVTPDT